MSCIENVTQKWTDSFFIQQQTLTIVNLNLKTQFKMVHEIVLWQIGFKKKY